jgi:hypothetical protein
MSISEILVRLTQNRGKMRLAYLNFCVGIIDKINHGEDMNTLLNFVDNCSNNRASPSGAVQEFAESFSNQEIVRELMDVHMKYIKSYNHSVQTFLFSGEMG